MTAAAETSALESRVGHYYRMDDSYLVGREKVREYARAVQDYHPAHWDVAAAAELGYSGLVAPLTFTSVPGMTCNRRMFEEVVVGYDTWVQTEEVFEQHRPIVAGDELHIDVELTSVRRIAGRLEARAAAERSIDACVRTGQPRGRQAAVAPGRPNAPAARGLALAGAFLYKPGFP